MHFALTCKNVCVRVQVSMKVTVNEYVYVWPNGSNFFCDFFFHLYFRRGWELNSAIYGSKNTVQIAYKPKTWKWSVLFAHKYYCAPEWFLSSMIL